MDGIYARRINIKHRLVYEVYDESKTVKIVSAWSHYETIEKLNNKKLFGIKPGSL